MDNHEIHEHHEKAAHHHDEAAKHHREAAKHHKAEITRKPHTTQRWPMAITYMPPNTTNTHRKSTRVSMVDDPLARCVHPQILSFF